MNFGRNRFIKYTVMILLFLFVTLTAFWGIRQYSDISEKNMQRIGGIAYLVQVSDGKTGEQITGKELSIIYKIYQKNIERNLYQKQVDGTFLPENIIERLEAGTLSEDEAFAYKLKTAGSVEKKKDQLKIVLPGVYDDIDILNAITVEYDGNTYIPIVMEFSSVKLDAKKEPPLTAAEFRGYAATLSLDFEQMKVNANGELIFSENELLTQAANILKKRLTGLSIMDYTIEVKEGKIELSVQNGDAEKINAVIQEENINATIEEDILNFAIIDADATRDFLQYYDAHRNDTFNKDGALKDPSIIKDYCELESSIDLSGDYFAVNKEKVITGEHITSVNLVNSSFEQQMLCGAVDSSTDGYAIKINLDNVGGDNMYESTSENVGKQIAISVNNQIIYVGTIAEALRDEFFLTFESDATANNLELILSELRNVVCPIIFSIDGWIEIEHSTDFAQRAVEFLLEQPKK
jgi:hypothetical protein